MYTPLGGRFNGYWPCLLWALAGIRNEHQQGMPPREVAMRNVQYGQNGNQLSDRTRVAAAQRDALRLRAMGRGGIREGTRNVSPVSRLIHPLIRLPGAASAYRALHTRVLVLR